MMAASVAPSVTIPNSSAAASNASTSSTAASSASSSFRGRAHSAASCDSYRTAEQMPSFQCRNKRTPTHEPRSSFFSGDGVRRLFASPKPHSFEARSTKKKQPPREVTGMSTDYYAVLGVPKSASKQDIKGAYRKLARQYHPDVNKEAGAEDKFKEISAAYEVLSDDDKKSVYDRFGEAGIKGAAAGNGAGAYTTNPFDLFESIFGTSVGGGFNGMGGMGGMGPSSFRTSGRGMPSQGEDLRFDISLEFEEAIFGAEKSLEASHLESCTSCNGSGAKSSNSQKTCSTCGGQGQVMQTSKTAFGTFSQVSICPTCAGEGEVITSYCKKCGGEGRIKVKKLIKVRVPPGVNSGSTLRVRGEGDAGLRGGPGGDLYVYLNVKEVPNIQRDGINLYSSVSINYTDAILGAVVQVKTVDGLTDLQIPAGTQPGDVLLLSKRGVPKLNKPTVRGDHLFTVKVTIPTRLNETERELVEDLADLYKAKTARFSSSKTRSNRVSRVSSDFDSNASKAEAENGAVGESTEGEGIWGSFKKLAGRGSRAEFGCISMHSLVSQEHCCPASSFSTPHLICVFFLPLLSFMILSAFSSFLFWVWKRFLLKR